MPTTLGPYHNLLDLPLTAHGPVNLELEFFSGSIVKIAGNSVEAILLGVPVFIFERPGAVSSGPAKFS
jgi:hypothetical protein